MNDPRQIESGILEKLARRVRQGLGVVLAGLEERDALSKQDIHDLRRDLSTLLERERKENGEVISQRHGHWRIAPGSR